MTKRRAVPAGEKRTSGQRNRSGEPTVDPSSDGDATLITRGSDAPQFLGDDPVHTRSEDLLGREGFARAIARTISERKDNSGLVIGLYAAWGEGKTSVLHLVDEELSAASKLQRLWFNPWYFRGEEQLVEAFFSTLAGRLDIKLGTVGDKLNKTLTKYGTMLSGLPTELAGVLNPGKAIAAAGKLFSTNTLDDLKTQIESALDEFSVRVVVFIDDVDRLDIGEVYAVLKLVKLTGGFRNLTYLLAFDDAAVARAVGTRYGSNTEAGRDFLEKIVQVPLRLPPADQQAVLRIALTAVDDAINASGFAPTESDVAAYRMRFDPVFNAVPRTLRAAKRYGNSLRFVLPLLKDEVNVADLMLLEALRVYYPDLYAAVSGNRDLFLGASTASSGGRADARSTVQKRLDAILTGISDREKLALTGMLEQLFPRLEGARNNIQYTSDWDARWNREKRVASTDYFDRYFRYAIAADDVSDARLDRFLSELGDADPSKAVELYTELVTPGSAERVVAKLRSREQQIGTGTSKALVPLLVITGSTLEGENSFFSFSSPYAQVTHLINALIRRLPQGERDALALEAVRLAEPLSFAFDVWRAIRRPKDRAPETATLSDQGEKALGDVLRDRLRVEAIAKPLYLRPKSQASTLIQAWQFFSEKSETEALLIRDFDQDAYSAGLFLEAIVPTAWAMPAGLPVESELDREHYDLIGRLIDHEKLVAYLRTAFGERIGNPSHYPTEEEITNPVLRAAQGYVYLHRVIEERAAAARATKPQDSAKPALDVAGAGTAGSDEASNTE